MMLSIGIIGLPNAGKSTLFNALTAKKVPAENYPFCTIEPNVGIVEVPDTRLALLAKISNSQRIVPAAIKFIDIAGLVRGASEGAGLGNQFLAHIRETDAICQVIRAFEDENIIHVDGRIDPLVDKQVIELELIMADLKTVEKRLDKAKRDVKAGGQKEKEIIIFLERLASWLNQGRSARDLTLSNDEQVFISELNLLSAKPIIYVLNIKEKFEKLWPHSIAINVKLEAEIADLSFDEQLKYRQEFGLEKSGLEILASQAYELLGLISFLTTGEMETKAWTIKKNTRAQEAAGVIHTDFVKNFIRAEVINWQKLLEAGSWQKARELGWIKIEGRDYLIQDGDVCNFLISH